MLDQIEGFGYVAQHGVFGVLFASLHRWKQ